MKNPQISQIHFTAVRPREGLLGFVQFVLDDAYALGGIGVHTRLNGGGIRLLYPDKRLNDGAIVQLFHPLNSTIGNVIEKSILLELQKKGIGGMI